MPTKAPGMLGAFFSPICSCRGAVTGLSCIVASFSYWIDQARPYSYRSASIGSSRDALSAG